MAEPNLNGVTPIPDSLKNNTMGNEKMYQQFNGVHSSQSSRSSSPSVRFDQIPASQLPPSRSPLTAVTHQMGRMNMHPTVASIGSVPPQQNPVFSNMIPQGRTNIVTSDNTRSAVPTQIPPANFPHRPAQQQGTQNQPFGSYQMKTPAQVTPNMLGSKVNQLPQQMNTNGPTTVPPIRTVFPPNQNINRNHFPPIGNPSQVTSAGQIPPNMNRSQMYPMPNQNIYQTSQIRVPGPQEQNFNTFPSPQPKIMPPNVAAPNFNAPSNFQNVPRNTRPAPPSYNSQQNPNPNTLSHPNMIPAQPLVPPTPPSNNFQQIPLPENSLSHPNMRPAQPLVPPTPPSNNFQQIPLPANSTNQKTNLHSNRYPSAVNANNPPPSVGQYNTPQQAYNNFQQPQMGLAPQNAHLNQNQQNQFQGGVTQLGFNKLWGTESYDLLQTPNILPSSKVEAPRIYLGQEALDQANCSPDIFRCTLTKIPENNSLLQKSRLPLGFLIHPFRDLSHLPVIQCNVIVRCKACRTYINPFVMFVDNKRWKCNLCYRINELPEEFQFDPVTKSYGDPSRRPEIKSSTLEYIAPAEYMLRPPQPAVYLYLLDVSRLAIESGYLQIVTTILLEELKNIPGDARTHVGFVAYDSALHFYSLPEGITQPQELTVLDTEEVFLPTPDNLLVNLKDRMDLVADLLRLLPSRFVNTFDTNSALGAALQAAFKMMGSTGGRVTIFQASLPNVGPGALAPREDPSQRGSTTEVAHLNPVNDFYKRLALECSGQQIAVDMFLVNSQYVDMATISGISRFSGGCLHHFPLLKPNKVALGESFSRCFRRYLTRKIGFEAVMRIRCTRGLSIHTFHGNFFVRSTDLLSLPNINPDAGFGMQVAIEESLSDVQTVCFQAALLYTSSKGERRIRVHTMCLPVASTLHDIINSADQQCIVGLLAKMAVDRSLQSSLSDAREAFINVAIDILSCYKITLNIGSPVSGLMAPNSLKLLPLYIAALLKHSAFRTGSIRVDDRVMAMVDMKTKPLYMLIQEIYPDLYPIHNLEDHEVILNCEEESVHMPPRLQLTARCLESRGAFLMDLGEHMMILVCSSVSPEFLVEALGIDTYNNIPEDMYELPVLENPRNLRLHQFINYLNDDKPICATLQVIRDNSNNRMAFFERLVEDRFENALSYHEFLQHLKTQVK